MRKSPLGAALASAAIALTTALSPGESQANGLVTHIYLADRAAQSLPEGPLRSIMTDPALRALYQNGAVFPDTGYGAGHPYGEWSHWEVFLDTYLAVVRERYGRDYSSPEARRLVAFGMGVGAHVMADQVFDLLFQARVREMYGEVDNLDIGSDAWLVWEQNETRTIDEVIPFETVLAVYPRRMGPATTMADLQRGLTQVATGLRAVNTLSRLWYPMYWREYPWGATHYMDPATPGSFPYVADAVRAYWQVLWGRLDGTAAPARSLLSSVPRDGQENVGVDHTRIESRFVAFLGYGVDPASVNTEAMRLLRPDGSEVPRSARVYSSDAFGNSLIIEPREDLAYDTRYRVELRDSLRFVTNETLGTTLSFSFRTRCAPGHEADCPPLPPPFMAPSDPPPRDVSMPTDASTLSDVAVPDVAASDAGASDASELPGSEPRPRDAVGTCGCRTPGASPRGGVCAVALAGLALVTGARRRSRR